MRKNKMLTVSNFAKFARTTRDTLIFYDKIGLLSPAIRSDNNYRYYSHAQLSTINLIRTLQTLGMPLSEIKRLKNMRTPDLVDAVLENQINQINGEINELVRTRELLYYIKSPIHSHLNIDESAITIQFQPEASIILGEQNDYGGDRDDYDALFSFYNKCGEMYPNVSLNYPVWGYFSADRIRNRDWVWPDRYYFYSSEGHDIRPAALYAIGYTRGGYGQCPDLYNRILDYIEANDYEISGPAYEEYPLNELSVLEEKDYLIRVMITVKTR